MKVIKFLMLFLAAAMGAQAQEYELGEVTKAELEEKQHPTDPSASAAILFSKGQSYMAFSDNSGFSLVTEVETKIKIYTKEGYDWANKVISFYSSDTDKESVDVSKAVTYNLVDGSIKKTKLKSDGEFTEQANKYWKHKKIMMPDVKEGCIIEFKYTIRSPFVQSLPEWRFQETIPVNHSEYTTRLPEYYIFSQRYRGYYVPKVTTTETTRSIVINSKERSDGLVSKTTFSQDKINYQEKSSKYVLDNLPAMKEESYTNNINNYTASIEHEISMIKYPNEPIKMVSANWEDVARTIYKYDSFGPELKRNGYYEDDIKALVADVTDPVQKAALIFNHVKSRMNWNEYYGYTCDNGVKRAYNDKVGNVAEINLMLTSMLRYAGLDANPVLVSTRNNKMALFPSTSAFNYVIAAVDIDGKRILLDATSKSAMPNILPTRAINGIGRLITNEGTSQDIDLTPTWQSKELLIVQAQLDAEGKITGKVRDQNFDYNAFRYRERYLGVNTDTYVEHLEGRYKGLEIGEYKVTNDKDLSKPVVEDYDFSHNALTDVMGDKIYINPMLFLTQTENPFKQEKREYPVDFIYPHQDKYMINIAIPKGYTVESLPPALALAMEDNLGTFRYNITSNAGQIQLGVILDINTPTIPANYYDTLKNFFQKVVEKQGEKIVLKKG
jgi:transglutaminase-like putative cysteine protease